MDTMNSSERAKFAERLQAVCDLMNMPVRGRQAALAKMFNVNGSSTKKWLDALSTPEYEICSQLAHASGVTYEWLMTGRGPKMLIDTPAETWAGEMPSSLREIINTLTRAYKSGMVDEFRLDVLLLAVEGVCSPGRLTSNEKQMAAATARIAKRASMSLEEQEADFRAKEALFRAEGLLGEPVSSTTATPTKKQHKAGVKSTG